MDPVLKQIETAQRALDYAKDIFNQRGDVFSQLKETLDEAIGAKPSSQFPSSKPMKASEAKLKLIIDYLRDCTDQQARQADIQKATDINAGIISVAIRQLNEEELIERVGRENKSVIWKLTDRATVVEPGEGVKAGRLKEAVPS